jgi:rhodanese-related sulfurtransferase
MEGSEGADGARSVQRIVGYLIDPDRLVELASHAGAQIVDVRTEAQRRRGFIPGSRHIPASELSAEATTLDPEHSVVFYGDADDDVPGLTEAFRAAGFTAYGLDGGVSEWERAGRELDRPDRREGAGA